MRRLSNTTNCGVPAVAATTSQLVVACRAKSNAALYFAFTSLSQPFVSTWTYGGGRLTSDVSVNITADVEARFLGDWVRQAHTRQRLAADEPLQRLDDVQRLLPHPPKRE